jgi:hypothetical protein
MAFAVPAKYETAADNTAWTVTPDLYVVCALACNVTVELFSDSVNESGCLPQYCSADAGDVLFGSAGNWLDVEDTALGAAVNPPFTTHFIATMLRKFDAGCRDRASYCRCAILPLADMYGVRAYVDSVRCQGFLLITIPPGSLAFQQQMALFSSGSVHPKPHTRQSLSLLVWSNREYKEARPPPADVEAVYMRWVARSCSNPQAVTIHFSAPFHSNCEGMSVYQKYWTCLASA